MHPRVNEALEALAVGAPLTTPSVELVHARVADRPVTFCVNRKRDPIQWHHRRGKFYEQPELDAMQRIFPKGGTFVDIGANIGNHTLYAALFLGARVVPVEPNPVAFELLIANVLINRVADRVDLSKLGVGLSDTAGSGYRAERRRGNLGSARLFKGWGNLDVKRGDDLLGDIRPDYIKIDVEGMEMQVLAGLERMIEEARPPILIEVDNANAAAFDTWARRLDYRTVHVKQRYPQNKNFLIADASQAPEVAECIAEVEHA